MEEVYGAKMTQASHGRDQYSLIKSTRFFCKARSPTSDDIDAFTRKRWQSYTQFSK